MWKENGKGFHYAYLRWIVLILWSFVLLTLPLYPYTRPSHVRHSHLECQKSPSHTITHLVIKQSPPLVLSDSCYRLSSPIFSFLLSLPSRFLWGSFCCRLRVSFLISLLAENCISRERERETERWAVCEIKESRVFLKAELTQKREEVFVILEEKSEPYLFLGPKHASEMKRPTS